jgi:SPP1 family holin
MKISKGTIVRTILMIITLINIGLQHFGYDIIKVDENGIADIVEYIIQIAIILVGFWKNNSFTQNAINADEFLKNLKEMEDK